jgi:hypothetical protein
VKKTCAASEQPVASEPAIQKLDEEMATGNTFGEAYCRDSRGRSKQFQERVGRSKELSRRPVDEYAYRTINLLKPTGHVTHQQFNIQQLYALPTLYLCSVFI